MEENKRTKIQWERPKVTAQHGKETNMPKPRSGHTFTVVGTNGFLFGGLGYARFAPRTELNDLWSFLPMCTSGLTLRNSTTVCGGHIAEHCVYACDDGFTIGGKHVCRANGFRSSAFVGGSCVSAGAGEWRR